MMVLRILVVWMMLVWLMYSGVKLKCIILGVWKFLIMLWLIRVCIIG